MPRCLYLIFDTEIRNIHYSNRTNSMENHPTFCFCVEIVAPRSVSVLTTLKGHYCEAQIPLPRT